MADLNELGITAELAEECIDFIQGISGITVTTDQLAALFEENEDLADELVDFGVDDTESSGSLASAFAQHVLDREWPLYGEQADLQAFVRDLRVAAMSKGYKVEEPT